MRRQKTEPASVRALCGSQIRAWLRTLGKVACTCGSLFLLATLSSAAPIEKSAKTSFVPDQISDVEPEFRNVAAMGRPSGTLMRPQDPDRIALLETGVPEEFLIYMRNFLKPEFVPTESYARENMAFARGVDISRRDWPHKVGDVAYLSYRVDGRDFLVSQTFDDLQSLIGISLSLKLGEEFSLDQPDEIQALLEAIRDTYLLPDTEAPFDFAIERSKSLDASLVAGKLSEGRARNYRQTLKGTYSAAGVSLVLAKLRFYPSKNPSSVRLKDMVPASSDPADKYFDRMLGRYNPPQSKLGK